MKYLGINLAKYWQDLYSEKCKTLLRGIKGNLNKWRYIPCLWMERLNAIKMSNLLQLLYDSMHFQPNSQKEFYGNFKLILKCVGKC